jgi:hypothetical protein
MEFQGLFLYYFINYLLLLLNAVYRKNFEIFLKHSCSSSHSLFVAGEQTLKQKVNEFF